MVCLLQSEGVPSVRLCASLFLCIVQNVERRPYHLSEALWRQTEGWFSWLSMCARGKETPKLFLVRAFHLLVSRTGTGDGCFLLEPQGSDSKSLWKSKDGVVNTKWWSVGVVDEHGWRNGGYFAHGAAQKDVQKTVVVPQIRYIAVCDATTKVSQFRVFRNWWSSAKCGKPIGWSMSLSRKRNPFFGFCSMFLWFQKISHLYTPLDFSKKQIFCNFCWKKIIFLVLLSLKIFCSSWFTSFFSFFIDSYSFCGRNDTYIGRGSSVAASGLIPFLVISLHFFSVFSSFSQQCFSSFFFFIAFFFPFVILVSPSLCSVSSVSFNWLIFFPPFLKLFLFWLFLLFCYFLNSFFSFICFLNPFVKTCHSFCLSPDSFFRFSVFFCLLSRLFSLFIVYIFFVNIVFSESSSFKCVSFLSFFDSLFWSLCFDPFVFFETIIVVSVLFSFFLVLILVYHFLSPPTKLFSLFHSVRLFVSLRTKNWLSFHHCCIFHFDHFLDHIFCFFVSFSFSFFFLRVFFILFVCLSYVFLLSLFLFFFSVPFFSLFPLVHSTHSTHSSLFPFYLFLLSTSLFLFRSFFFSSAFFLSIYFSRSPFMFSAFLYLLCFSLSIGFVSLSSLFCFFISFLSFFKIHFALLPSLPLSILPAFLDLHHLFFFFIAFSWSPFWMFWKSLVYLDLSFLFVSLFCAKAFEIKISLLECSSSPLYIFIVLLFSLFSVCAMFCLFFFLLSFLSLFSRFFGAYFYLGTTNRSETQDHVTKTQAKRNHR